MSGWIEFEVAEIQQLGSGRVRISGRCYEYPIRLGDVFTAVYRYVRDGLDPGEPHAPRAEERSIALTVERIEFYRNDLDELSSGLTGYVTLEGDASLVRIRDVIGAALDEVSARSRLIQQRNARGDSTRH